MPVENDPEITENNYDVDSEIVTASGLEESGKTIQVESRFKY